MHDDDCDGDCENCDRLHPSDTISTIPLDDIMEVYGAASEERKVTVTADLQAIHSLGVSVIPTGMLIHLECNPTGALVMLSHLVRTCEIRFGTSWTDDFMRELSE